MKIPKAPAPSRGHRRPLRMFEVHVRETIDVTYEIEAVDAEKARGKVATSQITKDEEGSRFELERIDWDVTTVKELR